MTAFGGGPVRCYSVVATERHLEAISSASSAARSWGPLAWSAVLVGAWFGLVVGAWLLLAVAADTAPTVGWVSVLASAVLWGWLTARYLRWTLRRRMRHALETGGWHVGSEHHAEFSEAGLVLRGPTSELVVSHENIREVVERDGAVLIRRRWSRTPALSVSELFPPEEIAVLRAASGAVS